MADKQIEVLIKAKYIVDDRWYKRQTVDYIVKEETSFFNEEPVRAFRALMEYSGDAEMVSCRVVDIKTKKKESCCG